MSLLNIFKRSYTIRRFGKGYNVNGYRMEPFEDSVVKLNVQPETENLKANQEGEFVVKRLKVFSNFLFNCSELDGVRGDWLWYKGYWYECISSEDWDITRISHCESEFVLIPPSKDERYRPPKGEDDECKCC